MRHIGPPAIRGSLNAPKDKVSLLFLDELLVSFSVAMAVTTLLIYGSGVFVPLVDLAFRLNRQMGLPKMNPHGAYLAWALWVITVTVGIFGMLRISRHLVTEWAFTVGTTLLAIGLAPAVWFRIVHWHGWYPAEVLIYSAFAVWYFRRKSSPPVFIADPVTAVHFWFWCERYWEFTRNPAEVLLPAASFFSILVWDRYRRTAFRDIGMEH